MLFVCRPKTLHKHCLQFLLGVKMALRETENNAYAKFWGGWQTKSILVCYGIFWSGQYPFMVKTSLFPKDKDQSKGFIFQFLNQLKV